MYHECLQYNNMRLIFSFTKSKWAACFNRCEPDKLALHERRFISHWEWHNACPAHKGHDPSLDPTYRACRADESRQAPSTSGEIDFAKSHFPSWTLTKAHIIAPLVIHWPVSYRQHERFFTHLEQGIYRVLAPVQQLHRSMWHLLVTTWSLTSSK